MLVVQYFMYNYNEYMLIGNNWCVRFLIWKESELHHSIRSLIDGAHPSPRTERGVVVGGCLSLVVEHWRLKPDALGSIPGGTTFLSFFPFAVSKVFGQ